MPKKFSDYINQNPPTEVEEMIARPPNKLLRSGITMVAGFTAIFLAMSWFIQYPDIIEAPFTISAHDTPVDVYPKTTGYIEHQFLYDGARCLEGDTIFYLHNTTLMKDAIIWRRYLDTLLALNLGEKLNTMSVPENLVLGEMSDTYRMLIEAVKKYVILSSQTIAAKRISQIEHEIDATERLNHSQERQTAIYQTELEITRKALIRASSLYEYKVISLAELEEAQKIMASAERTFDDFRNITLQNEIRIAQLQSSKFEIEAVRLELLTSTQLDISQAMNAAESDYEEWFDMNFIVALKDGVIVIPEHIRRNSFVSQQETVVTILPEHSDPKLYAVVMLPATRTAKVKLGQKAIMLFDAWPYKEYGTIETVVKYKSPLPTIIEGNVNAYETRIPIHQPAITTYGHRLLIDQRSKGIVRIITEERRVIERFFSGILNILKNQ